MTMPRIIPPTVAAMVEREGNAMAMSGKRASLLLLAALSTSAGLVHLVGQERRSSIGALLEFVREDVRRQVPPEMKPYDVGPIFLNVEPGASERDPLAALEQPDLERLGVTLVSDWHWTDVLLDDGAGGHHVRDDGVYVSVSSIKREDATDQSEVALEIRFEYYVTFRRPGRSPGICVLEWRIVQRPPASGDERWEVVEAENLGVC